MGYEIRYIRRTENEPDDLVAYEETFEHPSEDYLDKMIEVTKATFADVCRKEDEQ